MKNNLTPTVISDKNGKITTVHKKADSGSSETAKGIPAPAIQQVPSAPLPSIEVETYDPVDGKRFFDLMEAASKRPLGQDKVVFAVQANNRQRKLFADLLERNDGFWEILSAATSSSVSPRNKHNPDGIESIALVYDKNVYVNFPNHPKATKAQKAKLRLNSYHDALTDAYRIKAIEGVATRKDSFRLGELSEETVDQVRAYVKFHSAVQDVFPDRDLLIGELFGITLQGEHTADEVLSVVQAHRTTDVNSVLGVLNGSAPAVSKGWL